MWLYRRGFGFLVTAMAVSGALGMVLPSAAPAALARDTGGPAGEMLYRESFAGGSVAPGSWVTGGKTCLTAGRPGAPSAISPCGWHSPDLPGHGVLRLTGNGDHQAGFAIYTQPVDASLGLNISFDAYQYDSATKRHRGADGIAFVLIDGSQSPDHGGAAGGWLGYRGLTGGYIGVGLDEWGNFSRRALWGTGPDEMVPDAIVLRGAQQASYPYITGVRAPKFGSDAATRRASSKRHVSITLSTSGVLTVQVDFGHGRSPQVRHVNLNDIPGQPALPPTVKFGFTGATGDETAIHEVSNLMVSALRPDLLTRIRGAGRFRAPGTSTLVATVSDDAAAGPATGTVTALITLPGPLTPLTAAGPGWTCAISGLKVRCTHPGTLPPGISFPPITVTASVAPGAPRRLTAESSATAPGNHLSPGNVGYTTIPVDVAPPGPDLMLAVRPAGALVAGRHGKIRLDVSNAPGAWTAFGPIALTYHAPPDSPVISADGDGWTCAVQTTLVSCDRPQSLDGGAKFPPVFVTMALCHRAGCSLANSTATVAAPGVSAVTGDPGSLPVTQASALGLSLTRNLQRPVTGYDTTYTVVVTNGGPTDVQDAELTVAVPDSYAGRWTCIASSGSACPASLGAGGLRAQLYIASGGTVTLSATGESGGNATSEETATLYTQSPDGYCPVAHPCTATGTGFAGRVIR